MRGRTMILLFAGWCAVQAVHGQVEIGKPLPAAALGNETGGRLDGSAWSSESLTGKVTVLFYVDPDAKDANTALEEALKQAAFDRASYQSVAVINMAAAKMPNFLISAALRAKQKKHPETIYARDYRRTLLAAWGLEDHAYNVLLLDADGRLLYRGSGPQTAAQIETILSLIREHLPK